MNSKQLQTIVVNYFQTLYNDDNNLDNVVMPRSRVLNLSRFDIAFLSHLVNREEVWEALFSMYGNKALRLSGLYALPNQ